MRLKVIGPIALFAVAGLFAIRPQAGEPAVRPTVPAQPGAAGGRGKGDIERGPQHIAAAATPLPTRAPNNDFVNPKVEPGKVKWHADFDTACKAAAKSGKAVMLFQMMGKLDDQFC
jgi:hypothetical protein